MTALQTTSLVTKVLSPQDDDWQRCLDSLSYDFYHLPGYLELEAKRHHAAAEAIYIEDESARFFLPYLLRDCSRAEDLYIYSNRPIYDAISPYGYPGILASDAGQNAAFIKKCWQEVNNNWRERNICSAFIRLHPLLNRYLDPANNDENFAVYAQGEVVFIDLDRDLDEIWKQIRGNHRTKINKLKRTGFTTDIGSPAKYLDIFMDIYRETMDRVNATSAYYFTDDYFKGSIAALDDRLQICVVRCPAGEIVAASLITEFCGIVQYHLGGTRTEFLPQSPTTLMFARTIEWAKQGNNRYLNLGGGLGGARDSLFHFKSGFSQQTATFMTMKTIVNREVYDRLTYLRAKSLGLSIADLGNTTFFPAYRASSIDPIVTNR